MQLPKDKVAITIALFMTLTIAVSSIAFFPTANAVNTYKGAVYVSVSPDVIGVNQAVLLVMWTADIPPDTGEIATGGRAHWVNVGFDVTDPEGNTETITIPESDPVGGGYYSYTPTMVGTYTVVSFIPEQVKNTTPEQTIYEAARSIPVTFTVQEEAITNWPEAPLPTGAWTRPINDASRNWYALAGNWLYDAAQRCPSGSYGGATERFVYGIGPESAHIIWTKPLYVGGYMDERFGVVGYQTGHYQGLSFTAMIVNGQIFYSPRADAHSTEGYNVVDLYTGETLEFRNKTMPSKAQIYNYESPNQHGGYAYLWQTSGVDLPEGDTTEAGKQTWLMIDAYTGKNICRIANVSAPSFSFFGGGGGTEVYGLDGSICFYNAVNYGTMTNPNYYLQIWNNTDVDTLIATRTGTTAWQWRPSGGGFGGGPSLRSDYYVHDGNTGFSLNVSIPSVAGLSVRAIREGDLMIYGSQGSNDEANQVEGRMLAINLDPSRQTVGSQMYETTFLQPFLSQSLNISSGFFGDGISITGVYPEYDVICFECPRVLKRWGYSLTTGQQLWESETEPQNNYYTMIDNVYDGKLISGGYGGVLIAYNITTGEVVWNYTASNVGFESPYGNYPINIFAICDGKIYTLTGEHSITQPMWRGPNLRCINATTGEEIFKILMFSANGGAHLTGQYLQMADGHIVGLNFFDNQIYCFGKGDSATTVSAPQIVPTIGDSVVLTGTVTDQTPTGRRNTNDMFDFSLKGTPAISDEDMGAWMEYMFMQQGKPADAKGVEVLLETLDPNGNFYEIGTTTSDINGNYGLEFTPEVPGFYQIFATFKGSKSYGASTASTYMSVAEAPQATPTPTPAPPYGQTADAYLLPATIGIIVAIVVIGLVIILMLRKR